MMTTTMMFIYDRHQNFLLDNARLRQMIELHYLDMSLILNFEKFHNFTRHYVSLLNTRVLKEFWDALQIILIFVFG